MDVETAEDQSPLRRRLLAVLTLDAALVTGLVVLAVFARSSPGGSQYRALARTAAASLLPGLIAVLREERAHRPGAPVCGHLRGSVLLLVAGSALSTVGSVRVLARCERGRVRTVGCALLVGGNVVLVPYVAGVRHLHGSSSWRGRVAERVEVLRTG